MAYRARSPNTIPGQRRSIRPTIQQITLLSMIREAPRAGEFTSMPGVVSLDSIKLTWLVRSLLLFRAPAVLRKSPYPILLVLLPLVVACLLKTAIRRPLLRLIPTTRIFIITRDIPGARARRTSSGPAIRQLLLPGQGVQRGRGRSAGRRKTWRLTMTVMARQGNLAGRVKIPRNGTG